jgi:hypothetical protein
VDKWQHKELSWLVTLGIQSLTGRSFLVYGLGCATRQCKTPTTWLTGLVTMGKVNTIHGLVLKGILNKVDQLCSRNPLFPNIL